MSLWNLNGNEFSEKEINSFNENESYNFKDNREAFDVIQDLLNRIGLPMNFVVQDCASINCRRRNNAYATIDNEGVRYIIYDNDWLKTLNSDESKVESLTILAHEIGHHLSAHTIGLNWKNHTKAIQFCLKSSPYFHKETCEKYHIEEYSEFLEKNRKQEIEADRFAGYILSLSNYHIEDIQKVYINTMVVKDDKFSTHPSLEKRLKALEIGFELGQQKINNPTMKHDFEEIKGEKIDFKISNLSPIDRNILLQKIHNSMTWEAMRQVNNDSQYEFGIGSKTFTEEVKRKIIEFHGKEEKFWEFENEKEYFIAHNQYMVLSADTKIDYAPFPAFKVIGDTFQIMLFNDYEKPKIVYSAPFEEDKISFDEIKSLFVEIFQNGIQNKINEVYGKGN